MNILFLANWYPTTDHPVSGLFIREHARAAAAAGHKVVVLAVNITSPGKEKGKSAEVIPVDSFGVETHIVHVRSPLWKWLYSIPYFSYRYAWTYFKAQLAGRFQPDIIHSNIIFPTAIAGDRIARKLGKKHIITEHWSGVEKFMHNHPFRRSGRMAYARAAAITCVSEFLRKKVSLFVSRVEKISILPNVVDSGLFFYKEKAKKDTITFTAIATWNRFKLPHLFTEALERICLEHKKDLTLNLIGEGIYLEEIKKKKWPFTVNYLGNQPREKVAAVLQSSDFFLHASQVETFSIVTAEALLTGTPVIASNVGALPELINESNGILTGNSAEAWKKAIEKALSSRFDHQRIAAGSADQYSARSIARQLDELYTTLSR